MPPRRSIKCYSLHRRYLGLSCKEKRFLLFEYQRIQRLMVLLAVANEADRPDLEEIVAIAVALHRQRRYEQIIPRPVQAQHEKRTIASFSETEIPNKFRFRSSAQLFRLYNALRIPEKIVMPSRHTCTGEELFLVGLMRISSVARLEDIEHIFHRNYTWLSQVFSFFVTWIESRHGYRLYNNLDFWLPHFDRFSEAIRVKAVALSAGQLNFVPGGFRVAMVTDCCNQIISRPGCGPAHDGADAPRGDPAGWLQRVFYNGWLAACGMKYGTVESPCGLTVFASSGESSRHSDLTWLANSDINNKLERLQADSGIAPDNLFKMYGDSIFPWMSCLLSRYRGEDITEIERLENEVMSSCREHVEWHYGEIKMLFPFVDYPNKQQLLKTPVRETFVTTMILRNCYVCLNENKTAKYFNCIPPPLEDWLR
jgi:DDE superfamily endonuclease